MIKITGVILCVLGCTGYGMLKISAWNKSVEELQQWILMFRKMKSLIYYQREIMEEICEQMNGDIYGLGGRYVAKIGEQAKYRREKSFDIIWKEYLSKWKKESFLPANIKNEIYDFAEYTGETDYELQISFLDMYISNLEKEKYMLEKQIYEKKKPVMAISLIGGMVISILLL